jgi:hypothetical protein
MTSYDAGYLTGQILSLLCCSGLLLAFVAGVAYLLLRKKPGAVAGPTQGLAIPDPDATWKAHHLPRVSLELIAPPGVQVQEIEGTIRVLLPSGYSYVLEKGDPAAKIAERKTWLESTADRTQKTVLLAAPDAFVYSAKEGDLTDLSFVAGRRVGSVAWCVETHGSCVERADEEDAIQANLSPADRARLEETKRALAQAFARKEPATGPVVQGLMNTIAELTKKGTPKQRKPARVLAATVTECAQGIALVRSMRPLGR